MNNQKTPLVTRKSPLSWRFWVIVIVGIIIAAAVVILLIFVGGKEDSQTQKTNAFLAEHSASLQNDDYDIPYFQINANDTADFPNLAGFGSELPLYYPATVLEISQGLALAETLEELKDAPQYIKVETRDSLEALEKLFLDEIANTGWESEFGAQRILDGQRSLILANKNIQSTLEITIIDEGDVRRIVIGFTL